MDYPGDRAAQTVHLGAFEGARLLGVASIYHEPWPRDPQTHDWRLRGMAVDETCRGSGIGAALLAACAQHIASKQGQRLWCYARTPACGFYERFGLSVRSQVWDGGDIGPHVDMAGDVAGILTRTGTGSASAASGAAAAESR